MSFVQDELAEVRTNKKAFLEQMDRLIPWGEWVKKIEPYYYKGERGNKPYDLEVMLRIHILQNLYDLADMAVMTEVIDSRAFSRFCGVESSNQIPDGDTIGRFRNILTKNGLQEQLFTDMVNKRRSTKAKGPGWNQGQQKRREKEKSSVRAKVEHVFGIVKKQFRYRKTRYRGLLKTAASIYMRFTLANLILADRQGLTA